MYMGRSLSLAKYKTTKEIIYKALRERLRLGVANEALEITFIINCANLILLNKNNTYWGTQLALIKLDILIWKMCWGKQAFFRVVLPLMLLNTSFLPLGCFSLLGELKMRNGDGISGGAKLAAWSALIAAHTPPLLCCSLSLLTFQAWRGVEIADLSNGKMNAWWSVKLKISACMTARPDTSVIRKKNDGVRCI